MYFSHENAIIFYRLYANISIQGLGTVDFALFHRLQYLVSDLRYSALHIRLFLLQVTSLYNKAALISPVGYFFHIHNSN